MTEFARAGEEPTGTDDRCIDERDARALEQYLTVLPDTGRARDAADLYLVVSESGSEYLVDAREERCECPDHEYRNARCKHLRRVAYALGETSIPADADVDPQLGAHVDGERAPCVAATDGGIIQAGDDGEILDERDESDEPYTHHVEPPAQGGNTYVRCTECGAELLTDLGGAEKLVHVEGCSVA